MLEARFFCTDNGTEPVRDWLKTLTAIDRKAIGEDIRTVQIGWPLGMPLVRKMDTNLWEVRTNLQGRIARVLLRWLIMSWCYCMALLKNHKKRLSKS